MTSRSLGPIFVDMTEGDDILTRDLNTASMVLWNIPVALGVLNYFFGS